MIKTKYKLRGVPEALLKFRGTDTRIRTRGLERTMKTATQPMVRATSIEAPKESGKLRQSQTVRIKKFRRGAYVLAVVGAKSFRYANGRNPAKYSHLVHNGHRVSNFKVQRTGPRSQWRNRKMRWNGATRRAFAGMRVAGNPFAERGYRSSKALVQYLFNRSFANEVAAAARSF